MKTCVFTTVYPAVIPFLPDLLNSLTIQTNQDFEWVVVNDSVPNLADLLGSWASRARIVMSSGTSAQNRKAGLRYTKTHGYDYVIFLDADDRASDRRVEVNLRYLKLSKIVFNDLFIFGSGIPTPFSWLAPFFSDDQQIGTMQLVDSNCLGFSNAAIDMRSIDSRFFENIPDDQVAFDWAFFGRIMDELHLTAKFTSEAHTEYRQHHDNIASPVEISSESICRGVCVKKQQYGYLARFNAIYDERAQQYAELEKKLRQDISFKKWYCSVIENTTKNRQLWWNNIRLVSQEAQ